MATTPKSTTSPCAYVKDVRRNRDTRDWDAYVTLPGTDEPVYLGSRARSWDAEQLCDAYVTAQLAHQPTTLDHAPVIFDLDTESEPPAAVASIDTPTYSAYADSDGNVVLSLGDGELELTSDDLAELERVIGAGILRRLVDLARQQVSGGAA